MHPLLPGFLALSKISLDGFSSRNRKNQNPETSRPSNAGGAGGGAGAGGVGGGAYNCRLAPSKVHHWIL